MGCGTIGMNVDDGVRRCWVGGWVLVRGRVSGLGRGGGAYGKGGGGIGRTAGGMFRSAPAYELKWGDVRKTVGWI